MAEDFDGAWPRPAPQGGRRPLPVHGDQPPGVDAPPGAPAVGQITEQGLRLFEAKRQSEGRKAAQHGIALERNEVAPPPETPQIKTDP